MVSLTPTDAPTHLLPGHAGVRAGVVRPLTNDQAVLGGIITTLSHRGVTGKGRGLGQLPTLTAVSSTIRIQGAALPAAVALSIIVDFVDCFRSAVTPASTSAQVPAHE